MTTYRRKSTNVDTRHRTIDNLDEVQEWVQSKDALTLRQPGDVLVIVLERGTLTTTVGDVIVFDELLGFSACSADVFEERFYEHGGAA